jgi:hypothetical protein
MSLPERLVKESSLTSRQLESLVSYMRVVSGEIRFRDAASIASSGRTKGEERPLTIGSYYRTLTQARTNIRESLVTVLIGMQLGVVKVDDVRKLFELIGAGARELSEYDQDRFVQVLGALLDSMVL